MTTTGDINATGNPVFDVQLQAISEAVDGNGVVGATDLELSSGSGDMDVDIATGTARYDGTTASLGASDTVTLSDGDATDDRWDTIVYDVAADGVEVHEGTPAGAPAPPALESDEVLLGVVSVDATQTVLSSGDILNWRFPTAYPLGVGALDTPFTLTDLGTDLGTSLDASGLGDSTPAVIHPDETGTAFFARMRLPSNPPANNTSLLGWTAQDSNGNTKAFVVGVLKTDGNGAIDEGNLRLSANDQIKVYDATSLNLRGTSIEDAGTLIYDGPNGHVEQSVLEGPASSLTSYPLPMGDLSTITVDAVTDNPSWDTAPTYQTHQVWQEQTTPSGSPASNSWRIYLKSDGNLYVQEDDGTESQVGGATTDTRTNISDDGSKKVDDTTDINFTGGLNAVDDSDGTATVNAKEPFCYDPGMTNWETGLSDEEVDRIVLQTGETLVVERIEFRQKGSGSSSSASIDVRDTTGGTTIGSQNLGGTTKDPGSSGTANTVIVRLNNSTGNAIDAAPRVTGYIEGA